MAMLDKNDDPMRVLLVEDSFESQKLTKAMLHDLGVTQIYTAKNGAEALDLLGSFDGEDFVDLILCDWNMPVMNGIDLLKQVRTVDEEMIFVMITGRAGYTEVAEARAYNINGYIKKPFSANELGKKLSVFTRVITHRKLKNA